MPDPDLKIRSGGGGEQSRKNFFGPFGPQFGPKIRGSPGPPGPPALDTPLKMDKQVKPVRSKRM